jgi:hypothetical protein
MTALPAQEHIADVPRSDVCLGVESGNPRPVVGMARDAYKPVEQAVAKESA